MRRRSLLASFTALVASPAPVSARAPAPCLVWHADGVARRAPDGLLDPLPASPSTAPVSTATGVWLATREAQVECWQWQGRWQRVLAMPLPEPAHALAVAPDGRHGLVACGARLRLFDGGGHLQRDDAGSDLARRRHGRAADVRALPWRASLLAALPAVREWWEISLDPSAAPIFDGLVHDYRMGEAIARPGHLGLRRIPFDGEAPVPAFSPPGWPWLAARADDEVQVVHLDVRRTVARLQAPGANLAASVVQAGLWWLPVGSTLWGLDPRRWTVEHQRALPGPVQRLAVAGSTLHALVDGTVWRDEGGSWRPVARGQSAMADAGGVAPWMAPAPWSGVAPLPG